MNARASENYLAISRSASKSVEIFWAEIYWGRLFLGPNLVSFNRAVVPLFELSFLLTVMRAGGLAPWGLIRPTISLEVPVPGRGHCGFRSFPVVD